MPAASMKQLLESGVHFGHQTRRWNPKMKPYIFADRGGIHIIDLQQTTTLLDRAYEFVRNLAGRGGIVLFVGTKKQCQDVIAEEAERVGMPYVSHRWLGGLLTNFATIDNRIKRMHELRKLKEEGQLALLPTKERMTMERELEKLEVNLGGVSSMTRLPDAVVIIDPKRELIATKEVNKLGLPLIGLCDTNCDPDEVEYLIPGNDDAIRSCTLIVKTLARAAEEGRAKMQVADFEGPEVGPDGGSGAAGGDEGVKDQMGATGQESEGREATRATGPSPQRAPRAGAPARRAPVRRAAKPKASAEAAGDFDDAGASGGQSDHTPEPAEGEEKASGEKGVEA